MVRGLCENNELLLFVRKFRVKTFSHMVLVFFFRIGNRNGIELYHLKNNTGELFALS